MHRTLSTHFSRIINSGLHWGYIRKLTPPHMGTKIEIPGRPDTHFHRKLRLRNDNDVTWRRQLPGRWLTWLFTPYNQIPRDLGYLGADKNAVLGGLGEWWHHESSREVWDSFSHPLVPSVLWVAYSDLVLDVLGAHLLTEIRFGRVAPSGKLLWLNRLDPVVLRTCLLPSAMWAVGSLEFLGRLGVNMLEETYFQIVARSCYRSPGVWDMAWVGVMDNYNMVGFEHRSLKK